MTTTATTAHTAAVANGVNPVPFTFQAISAAEVGVLRAGVLDLVNGVDYTVFLNGDGTGNVTPTSSWGTDPVIVYSNPAYQQLSNFTRFGPYYPDQLVPPLDRLARTMIAIKDRLSRVLMAPLGEILASLPNAAARAGKWLTFDIDGQPQLSDPPTGAPGAPGANIMAIGLFTAMAAIAVPGGTSIVQTGGYNTQGRGHALYVEDTALVDADVAAYPQAVVKTANNRYFRLSDEQMHNPRMFGASGQGALSVDDRAAFINAINWLGNRNINPSSGGYYTGSPALWIYGDYYLSDHIDPFSNIEWIGAGSSHFWGGGAASRMRWPDGVHGVMPQGPNTSGVTGLDMVNTHKGGNVFKARGIRFEGGYSGNQANEGLWHGMVPRCCYHLEDCHWYGWSGCGLLSQAGTVLGIGNIGGNVSESFVINCKFENNYIGRKSQGGDANIIRGIGNAYYQNRLQGYYEQNGAGSCIEIAPHFAYNGRISNPNYWTQTSVGGYRYALRLGGNKNVAPSGGTDVNWILIEAGAPVTNDIPAYNAALDFRVGGDLIVEGAAGLTVQEMYSEYGAHSQVGTAVLVYGGTLLSQYLFGGWFLGSSGTDGYMVRGQNPAVILDNVGAGIDSQFAARKNGVVYAFMDMAFGAFTLYRHNSSGGHVFQCGTTTVGTNDVDGYKVPAGLGYWVNGQRVVQTRQTGTPIAAVDPATTMALANDLRTKLIAHGLIS